MVYTDNNLQNYFRRYGERITVPPIDGPATLVGISDVLKVSQSVNCSFDGEGQEFVSGLENCLDVVRGGQLRFSRFVFTPGVQNAITIKGGVRGYVLEDIVLTRHARGAQDIDIGNWCDYDKWAFRGAADGSLSRIRWLGKTRDGLLRRVRMADGSPVRVRCLYAERPMIEDCRVEWVGVVPRLPALNSPIAAAWFSAKRHGLLPARRPSDDLATLTAAELAL